MSGGAIAQPIGRSSLGQLRNGSAVLARPAQSGSTLVLRPPDCGPSARVLAGEVFVRSGCQTDHPAKEPIMTVIEDRPAAVVPTVTVQEPVVALKRRTIDSVLISFGAVLTVALLVAGGLLTWGSNFAADYVDDELSSQNITFPPAAALQEEGRTDLLKYAEEPVNTGPEAEAYASFINGHLEEIAGGATYAELGTPERAANAAVEEAVSSGASEAEIARLEGEAAEITRQRKTAAMPSSDNEAASPWAASFARCPNAHTAPIARSGAAMATELATPD